MAERREVTDPRVAARLERALEDLRAFAPDGVVAGLDVQKKKLGERLTRLYREIGYESRREMLEAYGFRAVSLRTAGADYDVEGLFRKLEERYGNGNKALTIEQIAAENPEFKSHKDSLRYIIKKNKGINLSEELISRGILIGSIVEDNDRLVREMVDTLRETYKHREDKPESLMDLFNRHPEYKPLQQHFRQRARVLFGTTAQRFLQQEGVIKDNNHTPEEVEAALALLRERILSLPERARPVYVGDAIDYVPEYRAVLKWAQQRGNLNKKTLQDEGVLRLSDNKKREMRNELIASSLRKATVQDLCELWRWVRLPALIRAGDAAGALLPEGLVELDTENLTETRESVRCRVIRADTPELAQSKETSCQGLRAETLLYALWRAGLFTDDDFLTDSRATVRLRALMLAGAEAPQVNLSPGPLSYADDFSPSRADGSGEQKAEKKKKGKGKKDKKAKKKDGKRGKEKKEKKKAKKKDEVKLTPGKDKKDKLKPGKEKKDGKAKKATAKGKKAKGKSKEKKKASMGKKKDKQKKQKEAR